MRTWRALVVLLTAMSASAGAADAGRLAAELDRRVEAELLPRWTSATTAGRPGSLGDDLGLLYLHALAIGRASSDGERDRVRAQYDRLFDRVAGRLREVRLGAGDRADGVLAMASAYELVSDARARALAMAASPRLSVTDPGSDLAAARALCRLFPLAPSPALRDRLAEMERRLRTRLSAPGGRSNSAETARIAALLHDVVTTLHEDPAPIIRLLQRVAWRPDAARWPATTRLLVLSRLYAATRDPACLAAAARCRQPVPTTPATAGALARLWLAAAAQLREAMLPPLPYHKPRARPRRAVQVDAGFAYYQGRTPRSVIAEVKANGFDCVHLVCTGADLPMPDLVEEAHRQGIEVWATFFPTGVYMPDAALPAGFNAWRMQLSTNQFDEYRFFSYIHPEYRRFWKRHLAEICGKHRLDGMLFYEVHYPTMNGPTQYGPQPTFSDVSPAFQQAFRRATGRAGFPNFTDPANPHYYKTDRGLFADFVEFRIQTIMDFQRDVLDGEGGFRRRFPKVMFATWTIALSHPDGLAAMRENESQDPARLVAEFAPDAHILQSHAPDWGRWDQVPGYVDGYAPYCRAVRGIFPATPVGLQADVGSTLDLRRTPQWMREVEDRAHRLGMAITTYYEFGLRWELYYAAPEVRATSSAPGGRATITFDQRIAPSSCTFLEGAGVAGGVVVRDVKVDGNLLSFRLEGAIKPGTTIALPVGGISSDPSVRFAMPGKGAGVPHAVPAGRIAVLRQGQRRRLTPGC